MNFNEQQIEAINVYEGAYGIVAGAGSGKTTVLINRIKNLIDNHKVDQKEILSISFTRNTADELKAKLNKMGFRDVNVGTFHSICGKILSNEGYNLSSNLIKPYEIENCHRAIDSECNYEDIASYISYQKCYMRSEKDEFVFKESDYPEDKLRSFYKNYEEYKKKHNKYDFDDYLIMCYDLLKKLSGKYTYDFVLVDEHQDSNLVQNLLLKELCKSGNIYCVFDPNQAIYKFRGGNPEYCMNFEKDWQNAKTINLFTNYRSSQAIVERANQFIREYCKDYKHYKDAEAFRSDEGQISILTYGSREEEAFDVCDKVEQLLRDGVEPQEIGILYRVNSHSGYVEGELKRRDIPYDISNKSSFFKRKEIVGIMSYLRLIQDPHDDNAFETIYKIKTKPLKYMSNQLLNSIKVNAGANNQSLYESFINFRFPKDFQNRSAREFGEIMNKLILQKSKNVPLEKLIDNIIKSFQFIAFIQDKYPSEEEVKERIDSLNTLKSFIKSNTLESFIDYVYMSEEKKKVKEKCVKMMSVHSSKGLEFKHTFVIGVEDSKFPHSKSDLVEEARLFYVAVTRAKDCLYLSQIGENNRFIMEYSR
ncbi:ATP-dependent helicase [Halalkalibacter oceani]|uniref:ATP-dependent helicase n=1 Tax=Halalkalibacter oceani TaxID=1653776 RepID=UPI003391B609